VRGFRIEPGEVEAVLLQCAAVREAVATVREDTPGDARLVAYLVARGGSGAPAAAQGFAEDPPTAARPGAGQDAAELRRHCQRYLPAHMVPSAFIWLARLPLTPSGKLDRRALAALPGESAPAGPSAGYVEPRGEIERAVAAAWQEVLQVGRVGVADNFFDLGGHSLLMLRLHAVLQERLGRALTIVDLFRHPTVESFARFLTQPAAAEVPPAGGESSRQGKQLAAGRGRLERQRAARQGGAGKRSPG
jgi:aryl carrier-like protein